MVDLQMEDQEKMESASSGTANITAASNRKFRRVVKTKSTFQLYQSLLKIFY